MCLINYRKTTKEERSGVGYKIFRRLDNRRLIGEFGHRRDKRLLRPVNRWLNKDGFAALKPVILGASSYSSVKYKPGWHVYLDCPKVSSRFFNNYCIRRVRYKKARLIGECYSYINDVPEGLYIKSVVADEIFIEKQK